MVSKLHQELLKSHNHFLQMIVTFFGQRINLNKSKLFCSQNMPSTKIKELISQLEVKVVESHE